MQPLAAGPWTLEPLAQRHAESLFPLLSDTRLYAFLDYGPPGSVEQLGALYRRLEARQSPDGSEGWLNWAIVGAAEGPVGYVQATVIDRRRAWVAYVLGSAHWGRGIARLCTGAMLGHLAQDHGIGQFLACVEQGNRRSLGLLHSLDFEPAPPDAVPGLTLTSTERLLVRGRPAPA